MKNDPLLGKRIHSFSYGVVLGAEFCGGSAGWNVDAL